jgi:hypothetical protein
MQDSFANLNDENICLDILKMTTKTNELVRELLNKELQMFQKC